MTMLSNGKTALHCIRSTRAYCFPSETPSALQLLSGHYQCKKHFGHSFVKLQKDEIPSALSKYELFSEKTAPAVLDVEDERQKITYTESKTDEFEGISMERGIDGVFDLKEIVDLLKRERGEDIFVVRIPPEYNYADYMVIVSGRSKKHMEALSDFVRRLYKIRVGTNNHIPTLEGRNSDIWKAIDLGNIILHVFSREGREVYDLETLWSIGKDFDTFSKRQSTSVNILSDYSKILASLSPNT